MNESTDQARSTPTGKPSRFMPVLLVLGLVAVYWISLRGSGPLAGWEQNFDKALSKAKAENKPLLVLFSAPG